VAIKSLRAELASVGTWSWDDEGAGCAVIRDDDSIVAYAKNSAECSAIAIHSKVSLAALDALIVAAEMMDRSDPRALSFVRESARGLIGPLYPRRWRTLESAEGLLALR
jgi:hypothetical protein